ncbi:hypothetical protein M9458_029292, partial [Cirrhinus mrigala]
PLLHTVLPSSAPVLMNTAEAADRDRCVGSELFGTSVLQEQDWTPLIYDTGL